VNRQHTTLFPECLEDWICDDNPVRVIGFLLAGVLPELHFGGVDIGATGRSHTKQLKGTALHDFA
jgi:hypothetical protein